MVGLLAIVVIIVVIALALVGVGLKRRGAEVQAQGEELGSSSHALRYTVPQGQDPAVVIAALTQAGYTAAQELEAQGLTGGTNVLIDTADGSPDREQVRHVLADVDVLNLDGDPAPDHGQPRFADE